MLALPLLAGAAVAAAQNLDPQEAHLTAAPYYPKPAVTIKAEARLVEIGVVVRDSRGHSVGGLTKSDFEVRDEGKRREITAFSVQSFVPAGAAAAHAPAARGGAPTAAPSAEPQPRWVGMVFDDISMPPSDLYNAKAAAKRFLKDGLAANDRVGVFTILRGQVLPFTADAAKIAEAIDKVTLQERKVRSEGCPLFTQYDAYQIANGLDRMALQVKAAEYAKCSGVCGDSYLSGSTSLNVCPKAVNAVVAMSRPLWEEVRLNSQNTFRTLEGIVDFMARMKGTRVILLASSGFLSGTLEFDEGQLVDKALHSNVVINSLDAKGLFTIDAPEMGQGSDVQSLIYQQLQGSRPKAALNDAMGDLADASGAVVPNAKVTAKFADTNETHTETANGSGQYRFSLMQPGDYFVSGESTGLKSKTEKFKHFRPALVVQRHRHRIGVARRRLERLRLLRSQDPLPTDGFLLARPRGRQRLIRDLRTSLHKIVTGVGISSRLPLQCRRLDRRSIPDRWYGTLRRQRFRRSRSRPRSPGTPDCGPLRFGQHAHGQEAIGLDGGRNAPLRA